MAEKKYIQIFNKNGYGGLFVEFNPSSAGVSSLNDLTGDIDLIAKPQVDTFTGLKNALEDDTDTNPLGIDVDPQSGNILIGFDPNKFIDHDTIEYINDTRKIGINQDVMTQIAKANIIQTTGSASNFLAEDGQYHAVGTGNDY
jgi:hypothetical protein